jgi:luciferase family oxidoreductase group 1
MRCNLARYSVLDFCRRDPRQHASQSLKNSLELAVICERLGYTRYWVAEHHNALAAQAAPEVLLAAIASRTQHICVGAGAVLLQYYSPLRVAETYLALEALFPGRIDLGLARGPGCEQPRHCAQAGEQQPRRVTARGVRAKSP